LVCTLTLWKERRGFTASCETSRSFTSFFTGHYIQPTQSMQFWQKKLPSVLPKRP
jgi:hypothetical protein